MSQKFLLIDAESDFAVLKSAASEVRVRILKLLHDRSGLNVNEIAGVLNQPQSSVSSNVQSLEAAGLIRTEMIKARKGNQKICYAVYDELVISFHRSSKDTAAGAVEVAMPIGLYTQSDVMGPCGICSTEGVIGNLDVPTTFLEPDRMKASLLWFTNGFVEYQFPNNALLRGLTLDRIEFALEVSSEVPGTRTNWPSDISLSINGIGIGDWTSPGDFGDKRGTYTPQWWKMAGSQYGLLKTWQVNDSGSYVDDVRLSEVTLDDLQLDQHRSVRLRVEVSQGARHPGGINIFGRGFGNHDQDIVMRQHVKSRA